MAVSPKLTSFNIRDPLSVRERLGSAAVAEYTNTPTKRLDHQQVAKTDECVAVGAAAHLRGELHSQSR